MPVPTSVALPDGRDFPLWTYSQLDLLNRNNLKRRALDLHTAAGPELSPQLMSGLPPQALALWIIDLQIALAETVGVVLTPAEFGVPAESAQQPCGGKKFPEDLRVKPFEPWVHNATTNENGFSHDPSYLQAAVTATAENQVNRQMHRGTLDTFLFSGGDPIEANNPGYRIVPPYQVATFARPNTATGKASVAQTSYAPPPPRAYAKGSNLWDGSYIGAVTDPVAPALPPLKR